MTSNVIIMSVGLSGSSVVAGLISKAGFSTGEETYKKKNDYDTYENIELIRLNERLFEESGFDGDYAKYFYGSAIEKISDLGKTIDPTDFQNFVAKCNAGGPWVWKDPRLWMTIRAWRNWVDVENAKFLMVTRDPWQRWVSVTLRRIISEYEYDKWYNIRIEDSIKDFFKLNNCAYLEVNYDRLLTHPQEEIAAINDFLGSSLSVDDLKSIYHGELKLKHGLWSSIKAILVYLKNYSKRIAA